MNGPPPPPSLIDQWVSITDRRPAMDRTSMIWPRFEHVQNFFATRTNCLRWFANFLATFKELLQRLTNLG